MSKVQSSTSKHVLWKASQLLWSRETHILLTFLSESLEKIVVQGLGPDEVDDLHGSGQDFLQDCWPCL